MYFKEAFEAMKHGMKVKLPSWGRILVLVERKADHHHAHQRWGRDRHPRDTDSRLYILKYRIG